MNLQEEYRNSITDLEELPINTSAGQIIKLKELARIEEYWCPPEIERKSRQRIVTVKVTPYGTSMGELAEAIRQEVDQMEIPQGINIDFGGSYEDQQETFGDMGILMALILMLVYVVMASQFESFSKPFIIMMAIPFAITGVIIALLITKIRLSVGSRRALSTSGITSSLFSTNPCIP